LINAIPVIGWIISFLLSVSLAIPFYFIWNSLAPTYFYFIPEVYKNLPFWDTVGLFMIIPILKTVLIPKFFTNSTTNNNSKD
jgi:hypothetical protein